MFSSTCFLHIATPALVDVRTVREGRTHVVTRHHGEDVFQLHLSNTLVEATWTKLQQMLIEIVELHLHCGLLVTSPGTQFVNTALTAKYVT